MLGDKEVTCKELSIREDAGYNEIYQSGHEPEEDVNWSPERDPFAHSSAKEGEEEENEEGEE